MKTKQNNSTWYLSFAVASSIVIGCIVAGCNQSPSVFSIAGPATIIAPASIGELVDDDDEKSDEKDKGRKYRSKKTFPPPSDLMKDWKKPDFALFITGRQHGYIEPCGCTGLDRQKGGLMRRHSCQLELKSRGWDLISIDAGNQIKRFGQQPTIKLQHTFESLCKIMNYDVIGFGVDDLKMPSIDLIQTVANVVDDESKNPFVSANVDIMGAGMQKPYKIIERGGKKVGIVNALCDKYIGKLKNNKELMLKSAAEGITASMPAIKDCDMKVLVYQTPEPEDAKQLAQRFPFFDVMVATTSAGEPTMLPEMIRTPQHTTRIIQVGLKGMFVGVVGFYSDGGKKDIKYERVALDARFKDSKPVEKVFGEYQKVLKQLYQSGNLKDVQPKPHPWNYTYVGSIACAECHEDEFEIWEDGVEGDGGPHFDATDSIVKPPNERGNIPRHWDPECLSCHATGWNPQGYYPYKSGFLNLKDHPDLHGNGCENCHGPGSGHVEIEKLRNKKRPFDEKKREQLLNFVKLTVEEAEKNHCKQCHDLDNSPDFLKEGAFKEYWEKIEH